VSAQGTAKLLAGASPGATGTPAFYRAPSGTLNRMAPSSAPPSTTVVDRAFGPFGVVVGVAALVVFAAGILSTGVKHSATGSVEVLPLVVVGVMALGLAYFLGLRSTLRFDGREGMLHIEKGTWGWVRKRQTIPLADIRGFEVKSQRGAKGGTVYAAVIVLEDGKTVDPLGVLSSGRSAHEAMADRMRVAFAAAGGTPSSSIG
jgi:hypothetical protein